MKNKESYFTHICDKCRFLGKDNYFYKNKFIDADMYFCHHNYTPSIIMRYGNKPNDYTSISIDIINKNLDDYFASPFISSMLISEELLLWKRN